MLLVSPSYPHMRHGQNLESTEVFSYTCCAGKWSTVTQLFILLLQDVVHVSFQACACSFFTPFIPRPQMLAWGLAVVRLEWGQNLEHIPILGDDHRPIIFYIPRISPFTSPVCPWPGDLNATFETQEGCWNRCLLKKLRCLSSGWWFKHEFYFSIS